MNDQEIPARQNRRKTAVKATRTLRICGVIVLLICILGAALITLTDPLQVYHKVTWYTPLLSEEERYQNVGLAKNYDYDTIIIGSSMTENFVSSEVGKLMGAKVMKLSMEGSTADEQYKIARLALETGKVKTVLWGLDYFSLKTASGEAAAALPEYLYDDNLWNDYQYWFNKSVYEQFVNSVKANLNGTAVQDLDSLYNWNDLVTFGKEKVAASYEKALIQEVDYESSEESLETVQQRFNSYILPLVQEYPDVEFIYYYPPYSIMRQAAWSDLNETRYTNQMTMRKWMFEQLDQYNNTEVYDFQGNAAWTYDLDLYKDLSHHSAQVNSWIAEEIAAHNPAYLITKDNIDGLNSTLAKEVTSVIMDASGNVASLLVQADGNEVTFHKRLMTDSGIVLLPAKEVAQLLGAELDWDALTKTITMTDGVHELEMTLDSPAAAVSENSVQLPGTPQLLGSTTMIPLSFTAEEFGWTVSEIHTETQISLTLNSF